jgi:hypothetical protein
VGETAQAERKTLSRLADEVMKHQWSNTREAMTALQELMDALPKEEKTAAVVFKQTKSGYAMKVEK